jgi:mevalonate kinase
LTDFKIIETSQTLVANHLSKILTSIRSLNPEFLLEEMGYHVEVNANYPLEWGLGSSSSLISMLASWANVNEYSLYGMISNGSAYDLACASHQQPIFYQLKNKHAEITETVFGDGLKKYSLFAYLGNKQSSQTEIERYQKMETPSFRQIERISELADEFCRAADARELMAIVEEHESILSTVLKKPSIKQREFQKFSGTVKSLGAWGGDFAMFTTEKDLEDMKKEIIQFGISQIFSYDELKIKV